MIFSSSTSFFWGVISAILAPFLMVLGFMIWDDDWTKKKGSAFSLNLFKCNLTAFWFLIVTVAINTTNQPLSDNAISLTANITMICTKLNPFQNEDVRFLMASSIVGILIGDLVWIEGLKYLGARKVIVMDSLKPFLAVLAGWAFFDEKFNSPVKASIGLVLTVVGVALVGLEIEGEEKREDHEHSSILDVDNLIDSSGHTSNTTNARKMDRSYQYGLFMAVSNVVLHTLGATLTKKFGVEMSTWEINFVRFGFAGLCMLLLTFLLQMRDRISQSLQPPLIDSTTSGTLDYGSVPTIDITTPFSPSRRQYTNFQETPWYTLPNLSRASWFRVTLGVVFVSFMTPALTNYAMFEIPLALLLTLESIGPLYSLPLAIVIQKECPSFRASMGAVFAVAGIALLSLEGKEDQLLDKKAII